MGVYLILQQSNIFEWETVSNGQDDCNTIIVEEEKTYQDAVTSAERFLKESPDLTFGIFELKTSIRAKVTTIITPVHTQEGGD